MSPINFAFAFVCLALLTVARPSFTLSELRREGSVGELVDEGEAAATQQIASSSNDEHQPAAALKINDQCSAGMLHPAKLDVAWIDKYALADPKEMLAVMSAAARVSQCITVAVTDCTRGLGLTKNYIERYMKVMPHYPLVIVNLDMKAHAFCTQYSKTHPNLFCCPPKDKGPASCGYRYLTSPLYQLATWQKPLLGWMGTAMNLTLLVSDIDVSIRRPVFDEPLPQVGMSFMCENDGPNTGFIIINKTFSTRLLPLMRQWIKSKDTKPGFVPGARWYNDQDGFCNAVLPFQGADGRGETRDRGPHQWYYFEPVSFKKTDLVACLNRVPDGDYIHGLKYMLGTNTLWPSYAADMCTNKRIVAAHYSGFDDLTTKLTAMSEHCDYTGLLTGELEGWE
jgi:hypothetical protein